MTKRTDHLKSSVCRNRLMLEEHDDEVLEKLISSRFRTVEVKKKERKMNFHRNHFDFHSGLTTYSDKKRKNFTHLRSLDDTDLAYRSMSNYLRQSRPDPFDVEPMEMTLAKNLPRTKSASEMTPRTTRPASGTPMYKAQEDYYDEVQTLKKVRRTKIFRFRHFVFVFFRI